MIDLLSFSYNQISIIYTKSRYKQSDYSMVQNEKHLVDFEGSVT